MVDIGLPFTLEKCLTVFRFVKLLHGELDVGIKRRGGIK